MSIIDRISNAVAAYNRRFDAPPTRLYLMETDAEELVEWSNKNLLTGADPYTDVSEILGGEISGLEIASVTSEHSGVFGGRGRHVFSQATVRVEEASSDKVNHPPHYTAHPSGVECIQVTEHMNFCLGNAIKYIWRADLKNGIEDLKKAKWYIEREIERRE